MNRHRRLARHHSSVAAYLALFLAVAGGAAYAAESINGTEIINGTLGTAELAPGAVTSDKLGALQTSTIAATTTVTGGGIRNGPSVRVSLARRSLVAVWARVDIEATRSGDRSAQAGIVFLSVPSENPGGTPTTARIMAAGALTTPRFTTKYTGFIGDSNLIPRPGADRLGASWIVVDLPAGEHDLRLTYQNQFNQRTRYRNATLTAWAMPVPVTLNSQIAPGAQAPPSVPAPPPQGPTPPPSAQQFG